MTPSRLYTIRVPVSGPGVLPTAVAVAPNTAPMRVLVRNVGGQLCFLGMAPADVAGPDGPTTESFRLPANAEDVFVIAAGQKIYAVSTGASGLLTIALSEALPVEVRQ